MHGIPADRVVLTGAQRFDDWFDRTPSTSPEEFARKVGLSPDAPYVLYLCSSPFIAPDEVAFVRRWAAAIRASESPAAPPARAARPPAPPERPPVAGGRPLRLRQRGDLAARGRPAGRRRGARRLLRLARPQRLHRRHQHERADRGGDRRARACSPSSTTTSPGRSPARSTSSTCAGRTAASSASPQTSTSTSPSSS